MNYNTLSCAKRQSQLAAGFFGFSNMGIPSARLAIDLPISNLKHRLALIDSSPKKVSSSAAHAEVRSSLLLNGRAERAEKRFTDLVKAIEEQDWHKIFVIS